jgi:hypothetical protein
MADDILQLTVNGQGVQISDFNAPFLSAGLADDRVLSTLLRLAPMSGTSVARAIVPYRLSGASGALVQPTGLSDGSINLLPFTAVVGSRTLVSGTAGTPLLNWKDVRSRTYAVSDDNVNLGHLVPFASNSSGNSRWDIVYVAFAVDQPNPTVTRNVRTPGTSLTLPPTAQPGIVPSLTQVLTIGVQAGATSATPVLPALPADTVTATGTFYIPLAAVRIPTGFGGTSVVLATDILMLAPMVPGFMGAAPPPNRLAAALSAAQVEAWGSTGVRPPMALPCTMAVLPPIRFGLDCTVSVPVFGDAAILDDSIDWRNRQFTTSCTGKTGATEFAWQHGSASGAIPQAGLYETARTTQDGQSYEDDSLAVLGVSRNAGSVFYANVTSFNPPITGINSAVGLYVDLATGALKVLYVGTPGCVLSFRLEATLPMDNF